MVREREREGVVMVRDESGYGEGEREGVVMVREREWLW